MHTSNPFLEGCSRSFRRVSGGSDGGRVVDGERFVKVFVGGLGVLFGLSLSGYRALNVLLWAIQCGGVGRDEVLLDGWVVEGFMKASGCGVRLSGSTFKKGLRDLEGAGVIAKTMRRGWYFINPRVVFNGDRGFLNCLRVNGVGNDGDA